MQPLEAVGPEGPGSLATAVSWSIRLVLMTLAAATLWNVLGAPDLGDVDEGTIVRFSHDDRGREADGRGAALVVDWLRHRARPSWNPFRVLWQQIWYNAATSGYDLVLWLEPGDGDLDRRHYAIYQSGQTIFLRIEFEGRNRVLDASFSADELERALQPFLFGPDRPAEAPPGRPD